MKTGKAKGLKPCAGFGIMRVMISDFCIKRFAVSALACALAHTAVAVAVRVDVPPPLHVDGEASAETLMPMMREKDRVLKITLAFNATPTNRVEFALGGGDGVRADSTGVIIGWRRGEWRVVGDRLRQEFAVQAANHTVAGPRSLVVCVRVKANGSLVGVAFEADGETLFDGPEAGAVLQWLSPYRWDALQVTARGDADGVSVTMQSLADSTVIIIK